MYRTVTKIARCYLVRRWSGEPAGREAGLVPRWAEIEEMLTPQNTFADFNRATLAALARLPL